VKDWWEHLGPDWRILLVFLACTAPGWMGTLLVLAALVLV